MLQLHFTLRIIIFFTTIIFVSTSSATNMMYTVDGKSAYPFKVTDQHEKEWTWDTYKGKNVILLLADRKGRDYIENWLQPLRSSLSGKAEFVAFADVSSVPFFLKGYIRGKIKDSYSQYPLLLDWKGDVFEYYLCKENTTNIVFIDTQGVIRYTNAGTGTSEETKNAITAIKKHL